MSLTRLYHSSAFDSRRPIGSYWEATAAPLERDCAPLDSARSCEFAVIGGGYTGLTAALYLAAEHGADVRILEAAEPAWGASGRNGGFCCLGGSKLSYPQMTARYGLDETRRFAAVQHAAVELVREFCDRHGVAADRHSAGELQLAHRRSRVQDLHAEQQMLSEQFGMPCAFLDRDALRDRGVAGPEFHAGLHNPIGFALHPLKYARALAAAALEAGVVIHPHSAVTGWQANDGGHRLTTPGGTVDARRVILATNGYSSETVPGWLRARTLPAMSSVLVTRPLSESELAAQGWHSDLMAYDTRTLLHYFRLLPERRFLFGGRGGTDASAAGLARCRRRLRRDFERMFPAWAAIPDTHFWSGFVCLARSLVPYVGPLSGCRNAWAALAYHGSGVAMGSWSGRAVAQMAVGQAGAAERLPGMMREPLRRFPLPASRLAALRCAYLGFGLRDRW